MNAPLLIEGEIQKLHLLLIPKLLLQLWEEIYYLHIIAPNYQKRNYSVA